MYHLADRPQWGAESVVEIPQAVFCTDAIQRANSIEKNQKSHNIACNIQGKLHEKKQYVWLDPLNIRLLTKLKKYTFCSLTWFSTRSLEWGILLSWCKRDSICPNHASTSFNWHSHLIESDKHCSNCVLRLTTAWLVSTQCSRNLLTTTKNTNILR